MGCRIPDPRGRLASDQHRKLPEYDRIGGTGTCSKITDSRGWKTAD